jgi:hypothetical protein
VGLVGYLMQSGAVVGVLEVVHALGGVQVSRMLFLRLEMCSRYL